jgi:hypothetical protein
MRSWNAGETFVLCDEVSRGVDGANDDVREGGVARVVVAEDLPVRVVCAAKDAGSCQTKVRKLQTDTPTTSITSSLHTY